MKAKILLKPGVHYFKNLTFTTVANSDSKVNYNSVIMLKILLHSCCCCFFFYFVQTKPIRLETLL